MTELTFRYNRTSFAIRYWENQKGVEFLIKVGIKKDDTVLDFGCRVGHYTIPVAKIIGSKGIVYAIDTQSDALEELEQKKNIQKLTNIRIIKTFGQMSLPLEGESIDVVLLYGVLHYFKEAERKKLYRETFRVLKENGLVSIYPKHCLTDNPIKEFQNMDIEGIKGEIQDSGFDFNKRYCDFISHDDDLNQGCVFNFRKGRVMTKSYTTAD